MRREALVLMITSASAPSSCVLVFDVDIFFLDTALGSGNSQKRRSPTCLKSQKLHFFVRKNKRPIDNPQPKNKSQFWNYEIPVNHKPRSRRSFFQCFFFLQEVSTNVGITEGCPPKLSNIGISVERVSIQENEFLDQIYYPFFEDVAT